MSEVGEANSGGLAVAGFEEVGSDLADEDELILVVEACRELAADGVPFGLRFRSMKLSCCRYELLPVLERGPSMPTVAIGSFFVIPFASRRRT